MFCAEEASTQLLKDITSDTWAVNTKRAASSASRGMSSLSSHIGEYQNIEACFHSSRGVWVYPRKTHKFYCGGRLLLLDETNNGMGPTTSC